MSEPAPTVSIRLPLPIRRRLDKAARMTRRSRSFLMQEALRRHLDEIIAEQAGAEPKPRYAVLLSAAGAGVGTGSGVARKLRRAADVDAHIRWLREND